MFSLGVITSYKINDSLYSSYVLGSNMQAIRQAVKKRNLNETIDSTITTIDNPLPNYAILSDEDLICRKEEILHSLCFISFVALKSRSAKIEEILGDEGVIHELSHLFSNSLFERKKSLNNVRDLIKKLQKLAVGLYEPV